MNGFFLGGGGTLVWGDTWGQHSIGAKHLEGDRMVWVHTSVVLCGERGAGSCCFHHREWFGEWWVVVGFLIFWRGRSPHPYYRRTLLFSWRTNEGPLKHDGGGASRLSNFYVLDRTLTFKSIAKKTVVAILSKLQMQCY